MQGMGLMDPFEGHGVVLRESAIAGAEGGGTPTANTYLPYQQRYSLRSTDSGFPLELASDDEQGAFDAISPRECRQMLRTAQRAAGGRDLDEPFDRLSKSPSGTPITVSRSESMRSYGPAYGSPEPCRQVTVRRSESTHSHQSIDSPRDSRVKRSGSVRSAHVQTPTGGLARSNSIRSAGAATPTSNLEALARRNGGARSARPSPPPQSFAGSKVSTQTGSQWNAEREGAATPTSSGLTRKESLRSNRGVSPPYHVHLTHLPPRYRESPTLGLESRPMQSASPNPASLARLPLHSPIPLTQAMISQAITAAGLARSPGDLPPSYYKLGSATPVEGHHTPGYGVAAGSPMTVVGRGVYPPAYMQPSPPRYDQTPVGHPDGRQTPRRSSRPSSPGTPATERMPKTSTSRSRGPTPTGGMTEPPPYHSSSRTTPPVFKDPLVTQRTQPVLPLDYYIHQGPVVATHPESPSLPGLPAEVVRTSSSPAFAIAGAVPLSESPLPGFSQMPVIEESPTYDMRMELPDTRNDTLRRRRRHMPSYMERDSPCIVEVGLQAYRGPRISPEAYKFFMEQHTENILKRYRERRERRMSLEKRMEELTLGEEARESMRRILAHKESNYLRLRRAKMDRSHFSQLKVLGRGGFAEVSLVRKYDTQELYALKTLKKADVIKRNQLAHVKAERDILAEADNEWVVKLFYSFQDAEHLYFVMDYIPGGDMLSLLVKLQVFSEDLARFYIAELVLAINSVHKMGFIHRDIKPDNVLIDRNGHVKLTDFGLCTGFHWTHDSKYYKTSGHQRQESQEPEPGAWELIRQTHNIDLSKPLVRRAVRKERRRNEARSIVGTPNYIAPEVLTAEAYSQLCDWWSVGVILFEMVFGQPPFLSPTAIETQLRIIHFEKTLDIPDCQDVSDITRDLIRRLCCHHSCRLGTNVQELKDHDFFSCIDWEQLRQGSAPYVPHLASETDTSNFDEASSVGGSHARSHETSGKGSGSNGSVKGTNGFLPDASNVHAFYEFTFRRFYHDNKGFPVREPTVYV